MFFGSYSTFIYILLAILGYACVRFPLKRAWVRNLLLLLANVLILLTLMKEHTLIVLGVLSAGVYGGGLLLRKKPSVAVLATFLTVILAAFAIRNYPVLQQLVQKSFLSVTEGPILSVQKIGLSYILFRYIHWLVEMYRRTFLRYDLLTFLNYIFFFPSFIAGPIDRYPNFHYWLRNARNGYQRHLFFAGITRVFMGAVKTLGLVPLVMVYATDYTVLLPHFTPAMALFLSLLAYSAYIYLDFSGYSDIAIGTAYMLGIRTPENFNAPYLSGNLSEFWQRWHMTFSSFLRMYMFKPSIAFYNWIFGSKYRTLISVLGYLTTFTLCGIWHGDTLNFVYWGLWHGVGLSVYKLWGTYVKPSLRLPDNGITTFFATLLTFLYVTVGWLFFHYNTEQLSGIFALFA